MTNHEPLVNSVGFDLLGHNLGKDVESSLGVALSGGVVFSNGTDPLTIFRHTLATSIRNIETHPRGKLFQDFMVKGPYEDIGEIPPDIGAHRLSDANTAAVITFIFSFMINSFKGAITELLASRACFHLMKRLQQDGKLHQNARLFVGDSVSNFRVGGKGLIKGADLNILVEENKQYANPLITVAGMVEVKSYFRSLSRMQEQLDRQLLRAKRGLRINGINYGQNNVQIGYGKAHQVIRITVLPDDWKLPRSFWFENSENGRLLRQSSKGPLKNDDDFTRIGDNEWRITLRWSKEALAEAAYEMTFWYMEKIGELVYSESVPKGWEQMTSAEAGRNAAKMMLYYAILRCHNLREEQRAIALYNSYSFGYALGMNFKNPEGRREMLWPEDLDEILLEGKTKNGCTIR